MDPAKIADASASGDLQYFTVILLGVVLASAIMLIVWLIKERVRMAERERELIGKRLGDGVARFGAMEKCIGDVQVNYVHRDVCESHRDKRDEIRERMESTMERLTQRQGDMSERMVSMDARVEAGFRTLTDMLAANVTVRDRE